ARGPVASYACAATRPCCRGAPSCPPSVGSSTTSRHTPTTTPPAWCTPTGSRSAATRAASSSACSAGSPALRKPPPAGPPDWPAGRARAAELLDRHQAEWQGPLTGWPGYWRFRRGFIEDLSLTEAELLAGADELFGLFPLRRLTVRPPLRDPAALAALPWL